MLEKKPLQSKKFIAFLISEFSWKLIVFYVLMQYKSGIDHYAFLVLLSVIVTSGFLQIGYVLGQAALDKYTAVAQTALENKPESPAKKP
jgi:hypothetical protein